MPEKSLLIIGAGIAGLCTGVYAQQNGYASKIVEMHTMPGGLATAWKRRGYTIDGCIHWLVGSSPRYKGMNQMWREVGLLDGLTFIDHDIFAVFEDGAGRVFRLYPDPQRLEQEMLAISPQDEPVIREFCDGIRFCLNFDPPMSTEGGLTAFLQRGLFILRMIPKMSFFQKWVKTTANEFTARFQDPLLRSALGDMWFPEFSMFFMLMTLAWLHNKTAGYPIGGTMPMIRNVEKRYLELGGQIQYGSKVEKILVEKDRAVGVRLVDGSELRAEVVISCADGHATIFDLLEGKYTDDIIRGYYHNYKPFPPILLVGVGVNHSFAAETQSVSGLTFPLKEAVKIGPKTYSRLPVHLYNFDPTLAPEGKSVLTIVLDTDYAYWKALGGSAVLYEEKKKEIANLIPGLLEQRWPGIGAQIEMVDVATPNTFERYTGNWQASFEGWLMTPENGLGSMKRTLPGLEHFYMAGQWVSPGGGLPAGVMTAREAIQMVCKKDGKRFRTSW